MAANIHHGTADPDALVDLIDRRGVDLLSVEELTPSFAEEAARAPASALGSRTRFSRCTGRERRRPLLEASRCGGWPGPPTVEFRMPRAEVALPGGRALRAVAVHPFPPNPGSTASWSAGLHTLPSPEPGTPPWVLPGDFNATLDHAELRRILDLGYRDAGDVTGNGLTPTWPESGHDLPPITIDHILAQRGIRVLSYSVEDIPGSDHRAVYARLAIPRGLAGNTAG